MSQETPEPFRVTVERDNGEPKSYVLMRKTVVLRGGKTHPIHYFALEGTSGVQDPNRFEYVIHDTKPRNLMPDEHLEVIARAMMEYLGMSAEMAAEVNGRLAAEARGYNKEERSEAIEALRRKLLQPPQ